MTRNRNIARVFAPLLAPARYKGAFGGRGSGKSHFFGEQLVEDALCHRGLLAVCIREVQKTLAQSSKRLIEHKIKSLGVGREFRTFKDRIETPGGGLIIFTGMQDPPSDEVGFAVLRSRHFADCSIEKGVPLIRVSEARNGHSLTLLSTLAHEMCHLRQFQLGDSGNHNALFRRLARSACRAHGFDLRSF